MAKPERGSVSKTHCKKSKEKPCLHKTKEKILGFFFYGDSRIS